jgi:hypothetical protein
VVKRAIAWKLIQCDLAWRLLPKRTSAILLKGNFERGEKDDDSEYSLTSPFSREIYEHG